MLCALQLYAFSYIEQILTDQRYTIEEKQLVQDEAVKQIQVCSRAFVRSCHGGSACYNDELDRFLYLSN